MTFNSLKKLMILFAMAYGVLFGCADSSSDDKNALDFNFLLRPDNSQITRSHLVWEKMPGAGEYLFVVMERNEDGLESVYEERTSLARAQLPLEFRGKGAVEMQVKALGREDEVLYESDFIRAVPVGTAGELVCYSICEGRGYSYSLNVYADQFTSANAQIQIGTGIGYTAYPEAQYLAQEHTFGNRHVYHEFIGITSWDGNVYDVNCNALSGKVYFVENDAGQWQYAVDQAMTTTAVGWDGIQICNDYGTNFGMRMQFNNHSEISPPLKCEEPCEPVGDPPDGTSGGTDGWPWGTWDDMFLGRPIDFDVIYPDSSEPGWADDIAVLDFLNILADGLKDVEGVIDGEEWILYGMSLAPVGEVEYRIDIDLDRFRREGPTYVREIVMELEDELYILVQYFGRDRIYAMALENK